MKMTTSKMNAFIKEMMRAEHSSVELSHDEKIANIVNMAVLHDETVLFANCGKEGFYPLLDVQDITEKYPELADNGIEGRFVVCSFDNVDDRKNKWRVVETNTGLLTHKATTKKRVIEIFEEFIDKNMDRLKDVFINKNSFKPSFFEKNKTWQDEKWQAAVDKFTTKD